MIADTYKDVRAGKDRLNVGHVTAIFSKDLPFVQDWTKPDAQSLETLISARSCRRSRNATARAGWRTPASSPWDSECSPRASRSVSQPQARSLSTAPEGYGNGPWEPGTTCQSSVGHGFRGLQDISRKPVAVTGTGHRSLGVT